MTNKYYADAHYTVNNAENDKKSLAWVLILLLGALLYRRIYIVKDRCGKKEVPLSFMIIFIHQNGRNTYEEKNTVITK